MAWKHHGQMETHGKSRGNKWFFKSKYKWPKLTQEEVRNVKRQTIGKNEVVKNLPKCYSKRFSRNWCKDLSHLSKQRTTLMPRFLILSIIRKTLDRIHLWIEILKIWIQCQQIEFSGILKRIIYHGKITSFSEAGIAH